MIVKFKANNMNNLMLLLFIISITLSSCRRNKESVGPDIAIASPNFKLAGNSFKYNLATSKFATLSNWFNASFNERVTWQITIKGTKSKAYKILSGTSNVLDQSTSLWTGTQSGIYFFIAGEKAIAELSVYGSNEKWYDTTTISTLKKDYGPNALIWWDMDGTAAGLGVQKTWYDYPNPDFYAYVVNTWGNATNPAPAALKDPVQGPYRSLEVKSKTPNTFWAGGFGASDFSPSYIKTKKYAFPGASLNEVYLNFYIRRSTPTTPSMDINVKSLTGKTYISRRFNVGANRWDSTFTYIYTTLTYTVNFPIVSSADLHTTALNGYVSAAGSDGQAWSMETGKSLGRDSQSVVSMPAYPNLVSEGVAEGWSLVSIRLDQMNQPAYGVVLPQLPFDPGRIVSVTGGLTPEELTGFDMDFIVFTRGVPFNQLIDQNP